MPLDSITCCGIVDLLFIQGFQFLHFVVSPNKVSSIVGWNVSWEATSQCHSKEYIEEGVGVKTVCYFKVYRSGSQAGEQAQVPFLAGLPSSLLDEERSTKVDRGLVEGTQGLPVRSSDNGAITCVAGAAFLHLHCMHSLSHSLVASLAEIIQYWAESWAST